jgi:hypothetical protein
MRAYIRPCGGVTALHALMGLALLNLITFAAFVAPSRIPESEGAGLTSFAINMKFNRIVQ